MNTGTAGPGTVLLPPTDESGTIYELGTLPGLAVPNTLPTGVAGSGQSFAVSAVAINAAISTSQVQYYSFSGTAGQVYAFQVLSATNSGDPHPIFPALEVLDSAGNLVPYAGNTTDGAYNVHEFESSDATILDLTLPSTGTYYIGVTTLPFSAPGNYQLFAYDFGFGPSLGSGDTLVGGTGNDTMVGSSGNDQFSFLPGSAGQATIDGRSGQGTVNLFGAPHEQVTTTGNLNVEAPTTSTVVTTSQATIAYGQSVTFTATVTASAALAGIPTGTVTFARDGITLGSASVNASGVASASFALPVGSETITATYSGDSNYIGSDGSVSENVNPDATTATLAAPTATVFGQAVTFTATVSAASPGAGTPTGTVTFFDGSASIGTDTLSGGVATLSSSTVAVGAHNITANYTGDSNFSTSTSPDINAVVTGNSSAATTTAGTVSGTQDFGQTLTFTATVTNNVAGGGTPTGSVDFFDTTTNTDLGSVTLSANGKASLITTALPAETQTITMSYAGTSSFLASSTTLTVNPLASVYVLNANLSGALNISGASSINVAGLVLVDSSSTTAIQASGSAKITASAIDVTGGYQLSGGASFSVHPVTGVAAAPDPLASLAAPAPGVNQGSVNLGGSSTLTINPGYYSQIQVSGAAKLTLNPGVYVIKGGGLAVTGSGSITGSGVLIYNAGSGYTGTSDGGNFGGITLSGAGKIALTPAATGPYAGIVIAQPHENTRAVSLAGSAALGLGGGVIYAPTALLTVSGSAQLQNSPIVVGHLQMSGSGVSTLSEDGAAGASTAAGQLLAGNLILYVDNSSATFSTDELTTVNDTITAVNTLLAAYSVTVTQVTAADSAAANVVVQLVDTTPVGGYADGVLGAEAPGIIDLVKGWNWFAGADPANIGATQYDFATAFIHELGHALGLGHNADTTSAMHGTLDTGTAHRGLTDADLNIPNGDAGVPAALHAAPTPTNATIGPIGTVGSADAPAATGGLFTALTPFAPSGFPASFVAGALGSPVASGQRTLGSPLFSAILPLVAARDADALAAPRPPELDTDTPENWDDLAAPAEAIPFLENGFMGRQDVQLDDVLAAERTGFARLPWEGAEPLDVAAIDAVMASLVVVSDDLAPARTIVAADDAVGGVRLAMAVAVAERTGAKQRGWRRWLGRVPALLRAVRRRGGAG